MKFNIISMLLLAFVLTGCQQQSSLINVMKGKPVPGVESITEVCLNGVSYYFYFTAGKTALAPRIDSMTLLPKGCQDE